MRYLHLLMFLTIVSFAGCARNNLEPGQVKQKTSGFLNGPDKFLRDEFPKYAGNSLGIVTNHTGVTSDGKHLVDVIHFEKKGKITAVFGPEHGFRGDESAGKKINDAKDEKTGIPVYSLYGETRKPSPAMLQGIDLMIFSIRDVGVRFYTYISTLYNVMEACGAAGIPVLVLDQPNIIGCTYVDGPVVEESLFSFIGITTLPMSHGMTAGELALYFKEDIVKRKNIDCDVDVVKMDGYYRETVFSETGLKWLDPSPNLRSELACLVYPGTCILENTNMSEGRGTVDPFLIFGAPYIDGEKLRKAVSIFPGIKSVESITFTPKSGKAATKPKYEGEVCQGVRITGISDDFESVKFGIWLIDHLAKEYPKNFEIKDKGFELKTGKKGFKSLLLSEGWQKTIESYAGELKQFMDTRDRFLLYTNSR